MAHEGNYVQELNNKIAELEQQLAEANARILALTKQDPRKTHVHDEGLDAAEWKRSEDALRQSEEKFSMAFQYNAAGMAIARAADAYFTDVNATFCQIVGYRREEIIGRTFLDLGFFPKAVHEEIMLQVQQRGKLHHQELDILTRHRLTRRVMFSLDSIDIAGEPGLLVTIVDITERKKAEEALAESERRQREITRLLELDQARLAAVLRHLPVGVWIADQNGRLTGSNEQADQIAGVKSTEYQTYPAWYPESGEPVQAHEYPMVVALRTGQPVEPMELDIRRIDGSEGTVLVSATPIRDRQGSVTGAIEVSVDITERIRGEEALRISEERFAKAFRASPNAITISQIADGRILEVNEGWKTIFGHTPEEVVGRTSLELGVYVDTEDRKKIVTRLTENRPVRDYELNMRRKSGEIRQVSLSAERIEIHGMDCLLSVIRDITEEKMAEQALRDSEHRLKRAQEIAHLGSWELDLIQNRLTWSDEVYRIFGLEPQQFAATYEAFLEAVHPEDRAAVDDAYSSSVREGRDTYEIEHRIVRRGSGEVRIVHEKCEHFRDEDGRIIRSIGMVHDITERKQVELALHQSEERFRLLASQPPHSPIR